MVKIPLSNAGDAGSIPGRRTKIPISWGATKPAHHNQELGTWGPQQGRGPSTTVKILWQVRLNTVTNSIFFLNKRNTFLAFHLFFWKTLVGLLEILEGPFQFPHCVTIPAALGSLKETQVLTKSRSPKHSPMPDEQPMVSTKEYGRGTTGELTSNWKHRYDPSEKSISLNRNKMCHLWERIDKSADKKKGMEKGGILREGLGRCGQKSRAGLCRVVRWQERALCGQGPVPAAVWPLFLSWCFLTPREHNSSFVYDMCRHDNTVKYSWLVSFEELVNSNIILECCI